jgi:hypothetical protein
MRTLALSLSRSSSRRRLAFTGLAIAGLLSIGGSDGQAADPFVAGGRSTRSLPAAADDLARARARGQALAAALGLPGVSQRVERQSDAFEHRTYDEVTSLDAAGREVAITRLELDGSVAMAVSLGWHAAGGRAIDGPAAAARAMVLAHAAGLTPPGQPSVRSSAGAGGWSISWPRIVDGVPVRGDGLRLTLWPDGAFHGLTRTERPLAAAPTRLLDVDAARSAATTVVAGGDAGSLDDLRIVAVERVWLAPNDMFGGARLDAPAETLRLAWAVRYESRGALADRLRSIEVWIDAGDGHLLGGDVVE